MFIIDSITSWFLGLTWIPVFILKFFILLLEWIKSIFIQNSPASFKSSFYSNPLKKINAICPPKDTNEDRHEDLCLEFYKKSAQKYSKLGKMFWGKDSTLSLYKVAWYNILAGECYEQAESYTEASNHYHYGAHTFRKLEEYQLSIDYYKKSAEVGDKCGIQEMTNWSTRSYCRAYGISRIIGSIKEENELKEIIDKRL